MRVKYFVILVMISLAVLCLSIAESDEYSQDILVHKKGRNDKFVDFLYGTQANPAKWVTDGALIVVKDQIVHESYRAPYDQTSKHLVWSVTKSFVNALLGLSVEKGLINTGDSICSYISSSIPFGNCEITVEDLLFFKSGLNWKETYEESESVKHSSVFAMLYGEGQINMGEFALRHELRVKPSTERVYSSGDSNLLSLLIKSALGTKFDEFLDKELFKRLGIIDYTIERDQSSNIVGSSYLYLRPRDMAKFGKLYLENGVLNGVQMLPRGWVDYSWAGKGGHFHVLNGPEMNTMVVAALGHWGQSIVIIPEYEMILVRTGDDRQTKFPLEEYLRLVFDEIRAIQ